MPNAGRNLRVQVKSFSLCCAPCELQVRAMRRTSTKLLLMPRNESFVVASKAAVAGGKPSAQYTKQLRCERDSLELIPELRQDSGAAGVLFGKQRMRGAKTSREFADIQTPARAGMLAGSFDRERDEQEMSVRRESCGQPIEQSTIEVIDDDDQVRRLKRRPPVGGLEVGKSRFRAQIGSNRVIRDLRERFGTAVEGRNAITATSQLECVSPAAGCEIPGATSIARTE